MQRMAAAVCLVAGVFVLLGLGWALLVAGGLLWVADERVVVWLRERADWVRAALKAAAEMPRRAIAGASMGVGLVLAPVGVAVVAGVGFGLAAAGVLLVSFGLLSGWGA